MEAQYTSYSQRSVHPYMMQVTWPTPSLSASRSVSVKRGKATVHYGKLLIYKKTYTIFLC